MTSHPRLVALAVVALAVIATGVGCGDGGSDRALATSSLDEAAFDQRVEAICADGRSRGLRFSGLPADGESEREALTVAVERSLLPALQEVVDRLYSLGAPAGEEEKVEDFFAALQQGVDAAGEMRVPTLRNVEAKLDPAGLRAERAGFAACIYS